MWQLIYMNLCPFHSDLNIKTDQNPPQKHFDKANNTQLTDVSTDE